jgi:pyruvate/2-oxoacid:ferredoxin oxidoreductase alpha subunit
MRELTAVSLVKVRLFGLADTRFVEALNGIEEVIVLDRNYSPGQVAAASELRAALYGSGVAPRIHGLLAGVGGVNVSPDKIAQFVKQVSQAPALGESQWVR